MFAAPWIKAAELTRRMNALRIPGVNFRPIHLKPFYATNKGEFIQGVQVHITDYRQAPLSDIQFLVMQEIAALYPDRAVFAHADSTRFRMFDKVCGSNRIREGFIRRNRWEDVRPYWYKDVERFKKQSKKYYLYP